MLVIKRDKKVEPFDVNKIDAAITKAFNAVNEPIDSDILQDIKDELYINNIVSVEELQDQLEKALMACDYYDVAKAFILYRRKRAEKAKLENEKSHSYTSPYSNEYFDTLMEEVDNYEFEHDFNFDSYRDGVLQIHPELARQPGFLENLDVWEHNYYGFHDYFGTSISEHDLYE